MRQVTVHLTVHMDRFLTAIEVRHQFLKLLEEVQEGERVIITRRGKPTAVIIDFESLQLLSEVGHLWQDPQSLSHIRAAHEDVRTGGVVRLIRNTHGAAAGSASPQQGASWLASLLILIFRIVSPPF
jgi:prevent-host-death family protein